MSAELRISAWRAVAILAVVAVLGGLVTYLVTGSGDGDAEPSSDSLSAALADLSTERRAVTVVVSDGPLAYAPREAPSESNDRGVIVSERGVVDFAAGTASATTGGGDEADPTQGPVPTVEVFVSDDGARVLTPWTAMWPVPLDGMAEVWELEHPLPPLTVDTTMTSVGTLLDLVSNPQLFAGPSRLGDTWSDQLDDGELDELTDERLEALPDDLAGIVEGDLESGVRATPTGAFAVTATGDGIEVIRVEYSAGELTFTVSWFLAPTDDAPTAAPEGDTVPFAEWRAAFDEAFVNDDPIGGVDPGPGAVLEPAEGLPEMTPEELEEFFGDNPVELPGN